MLGVQDTEDVVVGVCNCVLVLLAEPLLVAVNDPENEPDWVCERLGVFVTEGVPERVRESDGVGCALWVAEIDGEPEIDGEGTTYE